jgi:AbrB family transcriptional regulator, transcriptional pleiotropic regulator of transition state genes
MAAAIVRKIDGLGRIALPKEIRTTLNINNNDRLEFLVDEDKIILQKRKFACEYCDSTNDVFNFEGHSVCLRCMEKMVEMIK